MTTEHGRGRITTVGTLPNDALAADLARWLAPESNKVWGGPTALSDRALRDQRCRRTDPRHPQLDLGADHDTLPTPMTDILTESPDPIDELGLGPWDVHVLVE